MQSYRPDWRCETEIVSVNPVEGEVAACTPFQVGQLMFLSTHIF